MEVDLEADHGGRSKGRQEVEAIEEEILSALPPVTTGVSTSTHTGTCQLVLHQGTVREKKE